ncbi:MAG: mechanosensitive ion channel family protein [Bryobacteraceae bacterium]|jgi:small-conductance mechanosensitive channel
MQTIGRILTKNPMELVGPLAIFVAIFMIGWAVRQLVLKALRAWTSRTGSRAGLVLAEALSGPILIWAAILALHVGLQSSSLPGKFTDWGARTLFVLWIVSLTMMCMRIARDSIRFYGSQVTGALPVATLTQNLAQIAVVIVGALVLLDHFHVSITPMLTALGVGGLAVALAMQDTLSNLFGGFYVAVAGQVRLGDYIKLNTGEEGYVTDIGWRSTTIRSLGNSLIIVPNAKLAQAIVTNYDLPEKRMSAMLEVRVSYDCDPGQIERVLLDIAAQGAREIPGMLADPAPSVTFDPGFGDSALGLTVNYQVAEFASQFTVRHELRKRIFHRFREEGIRIPFPARAVYMHAPEPGDAVEPRSGPAQR